MDKLTNIWNIFISKSKHPRIFLNNISGSGNQNYYTNNSNNIASNENFQINYIPLNKHASEYIHSNSNSINNNTININRKDITNDVDTTDDSYLLTDFDLVYTDNNIPTNHLPMNDILDRENIISPSPASNKKSRNCISEKILTASIIMLLTFLAGVIFFFIYVIKTSLTTETSIKDTFSNAQQDQYFANPSHLKRLGILQPANLSHTLTYNPQARRSSEKLYELLSDFDTSFYDDENMILGTTWFTKNVYSRQTYVANGYIGSRLPNIGFGYALDTLNFWSDEPGALHNGWPLRNHRYAGSFISDFYSLESTLNSTNFPELDDLGYSTVIASIPEWTNLQFKVTDHQSTDNHTAWFNPIDVKVNDVFNYNQNLSMKDGIVTTEMDWYNNKLIHIKSEVWAHRRIHPLGVMRLEISLNVDQIDDYENFDHLEIDIYDILDFKTSERTVLKELGIDEKNDAIYIVVQPNNVPYANASIYSTCIIKTEKNSNMTMETLFQRDENKVSLARKTILSRDFLSIQIEKYVGIMSSEFKTNIIYENCSTLEVAKDIVLENKGKYNELLSSHKKAWYALYNDAFIEIPSDALLEMTARSSLYQLLANTRHYNVSERGLPVGVCGLSSDSYGGMVFWDSDIWMAPALLPFFPKVAQNMNNYRNSTHQQARINAERAGYSGAVYPWTSGRYANCTSTGPCIDYEYHINVDIALATFSIYMNGDTGVDDDYLRYTTWPIVRDAAQFFSEYVIYNETLGQYETYNLTDPDEYANNINNGAFTNAGIKTLLIWATDIGNHLGEPVDEKWENISHNIHIPRSKSNITLEYSGMNNTVEIKQADVTLMVYPLGYINDESILYNAIKDLYYYSERQSASGPAMTYPVFSAAAASLLNHGSSSQSYLYKSVLPYLRQPFAQFSEQADDNFLTNGYTQPAFPFLTANGGFLQSILFGLTGIRYSYDVDPLTKQMSRVLKFNPMQLPLMPGGLAIRNFKYMGQVLDIIIDDYNGTIVHKYGDKPIKILVPDRLLSADRDICIYTRQTHGYNAVHQTESKLDQKSSLKNTGRYYILNPRQEFVLPLCKPGLNIANNIVENQHITNLTAGVAGDVSFSAIDGNNYTHWQPLDKKTEGKLLIDLGRMNAQKILRGTVLWGQRPAKYLSVSILPHSDIVEQIILNITSILENSSLVTVKQTISELTRNFSRLETDHEECAEDILTILNWKSNEVNNIVKQAPDIGLFHEKFITVVEKLAITPSEPYFGELMEESSIELLPSNKTDFVIDYSNLNVNNTLRCFNNSPSLIDVYKARYIVLSVKGTFDDDNDTRGATIKEIAFSS